MENGDGSVLEADLPVLIESIPWGSWVRGEDLVREETTQEVITRAYYRYCGSEGKTFQYLDTGKRYYLDEDGILQTGTLTIDGKKYTFAADGSIKK